MWPQDSALGGAKAKASVLNVHREVIKGTQNVCSWSNQVQIISHCHAADTLNIASSEPIQSLHREREQERSEAITLFDTLLRAD